MQKITYFKALTSSILSVLSLAATLQAHATSAPSAPPIAKAGETWILQAKRSDEFDIKDSTKWNFTPENFGVWSWRSANATVAAGKLKLTTRRENHKRRFWDGCNNQQVNDFPLYYTSGIAKSKATGNYGYYEARIKGASTYPGVSPAFWMYSTIDRNLTHNGDVQYSEIDVVELTQKNNVRKTDHDLHNIVVIDGKPTWQRPLKVTFNHNQILQNFDPRDDFHTYGVNVTKDEITWYVDGKEIARKANKYWHRQMSLTLSQGLRAQLTQFKCNQFYPGASKSSQGFPTSMEVDYVRTWVKVNSTPNTGGNNSGNTGGNNSSNTNGNTSTPPSCASNEPVASIQVTPVTSRLTKGQKIQLSTSVFPSCAHNKKVVYKSSNPAVAVVSGSGIVSARKRGHAIITAKSKSRGKTDQVNITVQ